jgi:hypothetical protein
MHMHSVDIETSFLSADLKEDTYMRHSRGAEDGTSRVMRLPQSIFGLKQASREWYQVFHRTISSFGIKQATSETSLYNVNRPIHGICIIIVYVDGPLIVSDALD